MSNWQLANLWGILRKGDPDNIDPKTAWHAGRLYDVLRVGPTSGGPLLVANDGSGVWIVNESGGPAIPLSWDWAFPNVVCLAQGIHTSEHIYAGGTHLSETVTTKPAPLFHWRQIEVADANARPLGAGPINRIVVISQLRKIVLACDNGVFWATIPAPGGTYIFTQATLLPGRRFSGLAEGPEATVVVGAWGTDLKNHFGIFVGTWASAGGLTFTRSTILGTVERQMRRTDIAACATNRKVMYAVCGGGNNIAPLTNGGKVVLDGFGNATWVNDNDFILSVLRSEDGGSTWRRTSAKVVGETRPLFPGSPKSDIAGHSNDGYVGCVGVSPFNADHVAIGMVNPFFSTNGGKEWIHPDFSNPHLHADVHALVFEPTDATILHVCSDGGLATTADLGDTWRSAPNRQLPNLELYDFSPSSKDSGLIAASSQDNGNFYAPLYINPEPWRRLDGGDGEMVRFLPNGDLVRQNNDIVEADPSQPKVGARALSWDAGERQFHDRITSKAPLPPGVILVDGPSQGLAVQAQQLIAAVKTPVFTNAQGEPMLAVAADGLRLLGMFSRPDATPHWQVIGMIPNLPDKDKAGKPLPYYATGIETINGTFVFVGTNNGKVFRLDAPGFVAINISDPTVSFPILRFVVFTLDLAFLIAGDGVFRLGSSGWTQLHGKVLPSGKAQLPVGLGFRALAGDPTTTPPTLYVAAEGALDSDPTQSGGVFRSEDLGETWFAFSDGLPKHPDIYELRWVQESSGVTFLYLATFGWSVFRRPLNFEPVLKPVTVNGHINVVDPVVIGSDTVVDTPFAETLMLGPLHPLEDRAFDTTADVARVVLKLNFAWKTDFSVVLTVSADLIDEDDDEVEAHVDNAAVIAFGSVETVVIDLESDDIIAPDRAHIEFTVAN